jgi:MazG family protein
MPQHPLPPASDLPPFDRLVELMRILRGPDGCPWDRAQDLDTLKGYLVEEAYELLDAIDHGEPGKHKEELGDLLLQIVFQSQIRSESGDFQIDDVCDAIVAKMVRRHPHVFEGKRESSADGAHASWERAKARDRERDAAAPKSALAGVPRALPSLLRALRVSEKAAAVGFDWKDARDVFPKIREEIGELEEALGQGDGGASEQEFGDLLFALCNLARHLGINPEEALRAANDRFTGRFQHMEAAARQGGERLSDLLPDALERLWDEAKEALRESERP